ncbi:hypothetical protein BDR06DRAFT_313965 [Suillus hirtellus]|nr:hypothetical protein BDR06DRAFT_313965 [Suillus hirtellus]
MLSLYVRSEARPEAIELSPRANGKRSFCASCFFSMTNSSPRALRRNSVLFSPPSSPFSSYSRMILAPRWRHETPLALKGQLTLGREAAHPPSQLTFCPTLNRTKSLRSREALRAFARNLSLQNILLLNLCTPCRSSEHSSLNYCFLHHCANEMLE